MPKKQVPKKNNRTWVTLTRDFVKEWPEVLEGVQYDLLPITYVKWIDMYLKSSVTLHYDVQKELKIKSAKKVSGLVTEALDKHYQAIKKIEIKFDIPRLRKDIESKTSKLLKKSFT